MISTSIFDDFMSKLVENVSVSEDGTLIFNSKAKFLVEGFLKCAVSSKLFGEVKGLPEEFWEKFSPLTSDVVYQEMLNKISEAPTEMLKCGVAILMLPKLNELLQRDAA